MGHTPGPWHVEPVSYPERAHPQVYAGAKFVAEPRNSEAVPAPESDYNGYLIAAAPELLAACQFALDIAEDRTPGTWDDVMIEMRRVIRAALA